MSFDMLRDMSFCVALVLPQLRNFQCTNERGESSDFMIFYDAFCSTKVLFESAICIVTSCAPWKFRLKISEGQKVSFSGLLS
jgi:hypothetical protein